MTDVPALAAVVKRERDGAKPDFERDLGTSVWESLFRQLYLYATECGLLKAWEEVV